MAKRKTARGIGQSGGKLNLLALCVIAKNEEAMIERCIQSVAGIADEIIVYDTGSNDKTVEIAASNGAKVIEGYWDDSFSRARNDALESTSSEWILSLDADEEFLADKNAILETLKKIPTSIDAFLVPIESLYGPGKASSVHTAIRLFRKSRCTWKHRLHEQVASKTGGSLSVAFLSGGRILHYGYMSEVFVSKKKTERNLELAKLALEDGELSHDYALMNYGRALQSAGKNEEAIEVLNQAIEETSDNITKRLATRNLIAVLDRQQRFAELEEKIKFLRTISISQIPADIAEGRMLLSKGDTELGLELLSRIPAKSRDDDGMEYSFHMLASIRAEALAKLHRYEEAVDVIFQAIQSDGIIEADIQEVAKWMKMANKSIAEISNYLNSEDLVAILGRVMCLPVEQTDELLEAIWNKFPDRLEPLAAASKIGSRLQIERAMIWSSRLRNKGISRECPLVAITLDETQSVERRILAGTAAFQAFGETAIVGTVQKIVNELNEEQRENAMAMVHKIAPRLMETPIKDAEGEAIKIKVEGPGNNLRLPNKPKLELPKFSHKPVSGGINVVGKFGSTTLYGEVARNLAKVFMLAQVKVSTSSYNQDRDNYLPKWDHKGDSTHPYDRTIFVLPPDDYINFAIEMGIAPFENRKIEVLWLLRQDDRKELLEQAAKMVHKIVVTSEQSAITLREITDTPLMVMPMPIAPANNVISDEEGSTTFIASVDFREGFQKEIFSSIIQSYRDKYSPNDNTCLIIETVHDELFQSEHDHVKAMVIGRPDIFLYKNQGKSVGAIFDEGIPGRRVYLAISENSVNEFLTNKARLAGISVLEFPISSKGSDVRLSVFDRFEASIAEQATITVKGEAANEKILSAWTSHVKGVVV
jgi:glycosyltransferase involved in cell wall biosynthesis